MCEFIILINPPHKLLASVIGCSVLMPETLKFVGFCSDRDWNEAFNFSSNLSFLTNCIKKTKGTTYLVMFFLIFLCESLKVVGSCLFILSTFFLSYA